MPITQTTPGGEGGPSATPVQKWGTQPYWTLGHRITVGNKPHSDVKLSIQVGLQRLAPARLIFVINWARPHTRHRNTFWIPSALLSPLRSPPPHQTKFRNIKTPRISVCLLPGLAHFRRATQGIRVALLLCLEEVRGSNQNLSIIDLVE